MKNTINTQLAKQAFEAAQSKGFFNNSTNEHELMLVVSELSELIEADRIGRRADLASWDECYEKYGMEEAFEIVIKDTVEDEMADAALRVLSSMGKRNHRVMNAPAMVFENDKKLTDKIFALTTLIIDSVEFTELDSNMILSSIMRLAKEMNIDLAFHVTEKMKYNEYREELHGKAY